MDKKDRFYFEGVFYDDEKKFFDASEAFATSPISPISFERMWKLLGQDVALNIFNLYKCEEVSNSDMKRILEETLIFFLENFRNKINKTTIN